MEEKEKLKLKVEEKKVEEEKHVEKEMKEQEDMEELEENCDWKGKGEVKRMNRQEEKEQYYTSLVSDVTNTHLQLKKAQLRYEICFACR